MNVFVANEQTLTVDVARSSDLARHTLSLEDVPDEAELSVLYVEAEHIRRLNKRYAGKDEPTDVLAFPLMEQPGPADEDYLLGDVVICPEIALGNAEKLGRSASDELDTVLVHGTLHLLGYDHQGTEDKARMDKRLDEIIAAFGGREA